MSEVTKNSFIFVSHLYGQTHGSNLNWSIIRPFPELHRINKYFLVLKLASTYKERLTLEKS